MSEPATGPVWRGDAEIGLGWGYFRGHVGDNQPHSHHAVQICWSPSPIHLWIFGAGWLDCHGIVIGPDVAHRLMEGDQAVTLVFLEAEHDDGRRIVRNLSKGWRELSFVEVSELAKWQLQAGQPHTAQKVFDMLRPGARLDAQPVDDFLMRSLIQGLPSLLPEKIGVRQLADLAHLSPSRLQHRFARHTGMAVRPYLLWLRLLTAIAAIGRNTTLTDAALEAGFADSAHFSRTFRRRFGFAPRQLLQIGLSAQGRK